MSKATTPAYFSGPYIDVETVPDPLVLELLYNIQAPVNIWRTFIEVTNKQLAQITSMCTQKVPVLKVDTTMLPSCTGDGASQPRNEGGVKTEPPTQTGESPMSAYNMVDDESRSQGNAVEEIKFDSVGMGPGSIKSEDLKPTLYQDLLDTDDVADFAETDSKIGISLLFIGECVSL